MAVSGVPVNAANVKLTFIADDFSFNYDDYISVSLFTNGLYQIPADWQPDKNAAYGVYVSSVDCNGNSSAASSCDFEDGSWPVSSGWGVPFYDGRLQMKQNLIFKLRAAQMDRPNGVNRPHEKGYENRPANELGAANRASVFAGFA